MARKSPEVIEVDSQQLDEVVRRAEQTLEPKDAELIRAVFQSYAYVSDLVEDKNTTIRRLRNLFFGSRTEKTESVARGAAKSSTEAREGTSPSDATADAEPAEEAGEPPSEEAPAKPARKGHGRHGAEAYGGAERIPVPHESLQAGDACPQCQTGTVYDNAPGVLVRITGQPPLQATIYELQKLRCHLCGKIFTAAPPAAAQGRKYDATAASMIALLKYGSGMPFNRLQGLQGNLEIPLPASTQWEIVEAYAAGIAPAYRELIRQAAQGDVLYNDDTTVKILELMGERARRTSDVEDSSRRGLFTSGVVATRDGCRIALFFSGRQHAGENLAQVLPQRAAELPPPIQMCDALSRNLPGELQTIVAHCLAHARRQFVEIYDRFPDECGYLLEALGVAYRNDAEARQRELSAEERLRFHQQESRPTMQQLHAWLTRQFEEKLVEPNSALGGAVGYLLRHWEKLTLFLREAGAPLDNNLCERALKKAILHRKNALFYKSENGARVGDLYMSLIHTCELNQANPSDYLTQLMRYPDDVAGNPADWMPWNYRATLDAILPAA
jgi:transposase